MKPSLIFLLLFFTCGYTSQSIAQNYQDTQSGIRTTIGDIDIELRFYTQSCVRILKSSQNHQYKKESLSVIDNNRAVNIEKRQKGDILILKTPSMHVTLDLISGQMFFYNTQNKLLLKEKGKPVFTDFDDAGEKTFSVSQKFALEKDESIYGLGQLQNGKMKQRNLTKYLIQGNVENVVTFFQSNKGYGVFWDNYSPTTFKDDQEETSFSSEVGDCVNYYFMYGGNSDGVIAQMRELTGQVPMFPLWTYGFWQSKERYKSQDETVGVVKKYRDLGVPLDGIIQDWQYWGHNYLWNAMDFQNPLFNDPQKMVDDIHSMNAHMIISIWSSFGPATKPYRELDKNGLLFNFTTWPQSGMDTWPPNMDYPSGVRVYDAYSPKARDIYWK
ncbi:TIM-barrel domain-containing protein, partial [Dysgonomonas mossii]|uniref:TIM-barrel domain-containing protein n=2 Tax=Dysgonomonas TaxID=156973 RepID=UPI001AC26877